MRFILFFVTKLPRITHIIRYLCNMKRFRTTHLAPLLVLFFAFLLLTGCNSSNAPADHRVAVTIEPLRFFAEQIGGPDWQVVTIVEQGFSPEEYSPTPQQVAEVKDCQCLFKVGQLGFETTWLTRMVNDTSLICNTSAGISTHNFDPHTWTSPNNAKIICRNIAKTFIDLDPHHAHTYRTRLLRLEDLIDSVDTEIRTILDSLSSRTFVIAHPALTEFANEYGLRQIAIEQNGKEPTPQTLHSLINQAKAEGAKVVFVQKEFADNSAQVIAQQIGAKIVVINPLDYDWVNQILLIAKSL